MSTGGGSQFGNCSSLTTSQLLSVNLAFSVTGAICCFICSIIVLLLLVSKSFQTVLQRLLLNHMIATVLNELFVAACIVLQFEYHRQEAVCTGIAFVRDWAIFLRVVTTIGIMVYLFARVLHLARGNTIPQFLQSKRRRVGLEVAYVIVSPIFCLVYALVPFSTDNYGLAGAWCWVRSLNEDCSFSLSGYLEQLVHSYGFSLINSIVAMILMVAVVVVYCKLSATLDLELLQLVKKTFFVLVCFFVHVLFITSAIIYRAIELHHHQGLPYWYMTAISYPLGILLFPIAFVISFYPVRKICSCEKASELCCCCKKKARNAHMKLVPYERQPTGNTVPTVPPSTRVSLPSSTFFVVPYTDGFTHITTEDAPLVSEGTADNTYGGTSDKTVLIT